MVVQQAIKCQQINKVSISKESASQRFFAKDLSNKSSKNKTSNSQALNQASQRLTPQKSGERTLPINLLFEGYEVQFASISAICRLRKSLRFRRPHCPFEIYGERHDAPFSNLQPSRNLAQVGVCSLHTRKDAISRGQLRSAVKHWMLWLSINASLQLINGINDDGKRLSQSRFTDGIVLTSRSFNQMKEAAREFAGKSVQRWDCGPVRGEQTKSVDELTDVGT
ncbi:unnamed protein product [Toxocara canis]|uniref:Uncharacterized protein n=1 Tax=Toxocara canis TaxID=6265 RepID=A0A183UI42_TOXCA|nr:unnamed protein product [Toxocara canis]